MKALTILLVVGCACLSSLASNEYRVDMDSNFILELGGPPKLAMSRDEAEMYVCRFMLKISHELITIRVYTALPRDPLTKGSVIKNEGKELYAFGFRPTLASARIERRYLYQGEVVVENHTLDAVRATALDLAIVRSGFFEMNAVGPWLLKNDESGELLTGELMIDGRTTVVRRHTGESLPASSCLDAIKKATGAQ